MFFEDFLSVFKQIINEFRILNEHFDSRMKSKTTDYDIVFSSWTMDMHKRYRGIPLNMHWATSFPQITRNQILFDVCYKNDYFCEVKYIFDPKFIANFSKSLKEFLETLQKIIKEFNFYNDNFDVNSNPEIADYDKSFINWKKELYNVFKDIALDIHWENKNTEIIKNSVFFTIMLRDDYLFEIKYSFKGDGEEIKTIILDDFDDKYVI